MDNMLEIAVNNQSFPMKGVVNLLPTIWEQSKELSGNSC